MKIMDIVPDKKVMSDGKQISLVSRSDMWFAIYQIRQESKREREKETEKGRTDGRSRQLTLSRGRKAWDAKVDDPTSRGSRQGRAERSSVTNFARLCERRLVRVWGA